MFVVIVLLEFFVEPATRIVAADGRKTAVDFPIVARTKRLDALFALHHDRERRGLHASDCGELKPARFGVERRHCAGAVDADQPIRFAAAHSRVGQTQLRFIGQQILEARADRGRCHRLQPQALDRLLGLRILHDVTKDQFAFAARIAGVDERINILAFEQSLQPFQALLGSFDRL